MTTQVILILVIIGLALVCACLLVVIKRYRFKDDYKRKLSDWDDTDRIYWKDISD